MSRPWISCNLAISADGKISSPGHRPADWTSKDDLQRLKALRQPAHALMVGRATAETDRMTMRVEGRDRQPLRCIVSRHGGLAADHPIHHSPGGDIHYLATEGYHGTTPDGVVVHECPLESFLGILHRDLGVSHLHCEGGGQLIRALCELDAIDEFHVTLAGHTLLGGAESPTATGIPGGFLPASRAFEVSHFAPRPDLGECFLSYRRIQ